MIFEAVDGPQIIDEIPECSDGVENGRPLFAAAPWPMTPQRVKVR